MENRPLVRQLGDNVRRLRKDCGLSLAEVSSRMGALGVPLSLNGISKVELGNRELGLDEIAALARALDVAPLQVIFPIGLEPVVELLPGASVATWAAAKWFTGEAAFPVVLPNASWIPAEERLDELPTTYFREQDRIVAEWGRARQQLTEARARLVEQEGAGRGDMALAMAREVSYVEDLLRRTEEELRRHRSVMGNKGMNPGNLPPELRHVDSPRG